MKKILTMVFLFCIALNAFSQERVLRNNNPAKFDLNSVQENHTPKAPSVDRVGGYPITPIPGTDGFFDYRTNGANMSGLWVSGDTIIHSYFSIDSVNAATLTTMLGYYTISFDGGATWSAAPHALTTLPTRSVFPELMPYIGVSGRNIALTGRLYKPAGSRGGAWTEAFLDLGSFTSLNVPEPGSDYFGHYLNGDFVGGVYSSELDADNDSLFFIKYDIQSVSYSGKTLITPPTVNIEANVRYRFTADETGNNLFVMWWDATGGAEALNMKTSSDGGTTWSSVTTLQQTSVTNGVINGDTCSPWFGYDAQYKPGTSDIYAAWNTLYPTGTGQSAGDNQGSKILLWSPGLNSGTPVEVAGKTNMSIISDTSIYNPVNAGAISLQVGVTPVSHPTIGFTSDGSRMAMAFSGYQPISDTLDLFARNDIWVTYSDDGGATWSTPENLTNTPDWDELYPCIAPTGNSSTEFHIYFQTTVGPGSQNFTDLTPVYRVHEIYRTYNPENVAITNISNVIPDAFSLKQNYPNPFNPSTSIRFDIAKTSMVTLKIFDVTGKEVAVLVNNETVTPGTKEVNFKASKLSSGIYFYTLSSVDFSETKKMMLIK